eukprot:jgi/Galph1/1285/GphlegSOOS_G6080.1
MWRCPNGKQLCFASQDYTKEHEKEYNNKLSNETIFTQGSNIDLGESTTEQHDKEDSHHSLEEVEEEEPVLDIDEEIKNNPPQWYLLQVTRGKEKAVRDALLLKARNTRILRGRLIDVIVPLTRKVVLSSKGIPKVREEAIFSGYVLVKFILTDSAERLVRQTHFISGFVTSGKKERGKASPKPLKDSEVEEILQKAQSRQAVDAATEFLCMLVLISYDFQKDVYGVISEISNTFQYAKVACLLYGSPTSVEVPIESIKKVSDEEFEEAMKEYVKSCSQEKVKNKKTNVSSEKLLSVLSRSMDKERQVSQNANEIDVFLDDLEVEERDRVKKEQATTGTDHSNEPFVASPIAGDSDLSSNELFYNK